MGQVDESAGFKVVVPRSFLQSCIILLAKNSFLVVYGILNIHNFVYITWACTLLQRMYEFMGQVDDDESADSKLLSLIPSILHHFVGQEIPS